MGEEGGRGTKNTAKDSGVERRKAGERPRYVPRNGQEPPVVAANSCPSSISEDGFYAFM